MKTITFSSLLAIFLFSCQSGISVENSNKEYAKKKAADLTINDTDPVANSNGDLATTDAPIDGGLGILLIAGAAYGARRFKNKKAQA